MLYFIPKSQYSPDNWFSLSVIIENLRLDSLETLIFDSAEPGLSWRQQLAWFTDGKARSDPIRQEYCRQKVGSLLNKPLADREINKV
jgi:hypothetical protein